ncbi:metallophosphoesterase [Cellulosilyticum sp. ST5]|uniref:metallophosphoesterase family protein n=1 Tax=unclassified Cellulosilyticum TaxID=2643091 RepID=UPI000F8E0A19|nr:metallophosphoesterase [Cellulosilyticum sp. WCF-2]QEH68388.1 metallophosphoesterase [Cellulosilyticum sp. WCF-2]
MKVLIISDTHGKIENVKMILERTIPLGVGTVLHCGDYVSDARLLQKYYPGVEIHYVYGNCDVGFGGAYSEVVTIEGISFYMTHGHRYGVKWGEYDDLIIDAIAHEAQVAVCGHSHCAHIERKEDVLLLNPGSMTQPRDGKYPSYAIVEVKGGQIKEANIMQIIENENVIIHPISNRYRVR